MKVNEQNRYSKIVSVPRPLGVPVTVIISAWKMSSRNYGRCTLSEAQLRRNLGKPEWIAKFDVCRDLFILDTASRLMWTCGGGWHLSPVVSDCVDRLSIIIFHFILVWKVFPHHMLQRAIEERQRMCSCWIASVLYFKKPVLVYCL